MCKMVLPITLCMIIKNEESFLEHCLDSVKGYVSEVVIADTGSTDRTVQIAKQLGANVIEIEWKDDFAAARNEVKSRATMPYIFMMDADERIDPMSIGALEKYIRSGVFAPGRVIIKNIVDQQECTYGLATRIFPNDPGYSYSGRIHEQLRYNGSAPHGVDTDIKLVHLGYQREQIITRNKIERNLRILLEISNNDPKDLYTLYQLGKTYYVAKEYGKSLECLNKMFDLIPERSITEVTFASSAWLTICYDLYYLKQYSLLKEYIESGIALFNDYTDLYFIYGLALTSMNHPDAVSLIPSVFNHCLVLGEANPNKYETSRGVGSFKAHYNLGVYWEMTGNVESATYHYSEAASLGYQVAEKRLKKWRSTGESDEEHNFSLYDCQE